MAINGSRSAFPGAIDDWGNEFENNQCQRWRADRWNWIQDAVYALEKQTRRVVITGDSRYRSAAEGWARPRMLFKVYQVELTGSPSEVKVATLPAFTADEKALFDGTPLGPECTVTLQVRKLTPEGRAKGAFVCGLQTPLTDYSGDSGFQVAVSTLRDRTDGGEIRVASGTYLITLMINR